MCQIPNIDENFISYLYVEEVASFLVLEAFAVQ